MATKGTRLELAPCWGRVEAPLFYKEGLCALSDWSERVLCGRERLVLALQSRSRGETYRERTSPIRRGSKLEPRMREGWLITLNNEKGKVIPLLLFFASRRLSTAGDASVAGKGEREG